MSYSLDDCLLNPFPVSRAEARREVENHDADWHEFVEEHGNRAEYWSDEVLGWLGWA
jgi:hypothetical protein